MLNVTEISNRIQNPNLVVPEDLSSLKELTEKYPYTQLFSILYLKALSKSGDVRFEDELKQHSYRISDRVQLFELIENHEAPANSAKTDQIEVTSIAVELKALETATEEISQKPNVEAEESKNDAAPITESKEEITEEVVEDQELEAKEITEIEFITEPEVIQSKTEEISIEEEIITPTRTDDKLEESILHHALASNYHLDELTEDEEAGLEKKQAIEEIAEQEENEKTEEAIVSDSQESPSSFTGWLHSNSNYQEQDSSDKEAINAVVDDFADFDPSNELFGETEKPKAEFFSPTKKAKRSLEENELPVSETLAKIYIMQGNYPQAISAYKQLSLAFPEKKIFFANLIEDLEKKINT